MVTVVDREETLPITSPCTEEATAGFHIVQAGESLFGIARIYGIGPKDLMSWNNLTEQEVIHPCQQLTVTPPVSYETVTETFQVKGEPTVYEVVEERISVPDPCEEVSTETFHVVQPGQTLNQIAALNQVSLEQLRAWNDLANINYITPCSKIRVKASVVAAAVPTSYEVVTERLAQNQQSIRCPESSSPGVHVVQPGQTLYQIARFYGLTVAQIQGWNNLSDTDQLVACSKLRVAVPTSYEYVEKGPVKCKGKIDSRASRGSKWRNLVSVS